MTDFGQARDRQLSLDGWLAELLAQPGMAGLSIDRASQRALLELTRVAAHRSERIAAPISAYLVGLACAGLPEAERARRIESLARSLEIETQRS